MRTSNEGLNSIKQHEALRTKSYLDIVGVLTIGYGHTMNVELNQTISEGEALRLLRADVYRAESSINKYVLEKRIPLQQNQYDALVSLVFNLGSHAIFTKQYNNGYKSGSTLYNKLLLLDFQATADCFMSFVKAGGVVVRGLQNRRTIERNLFLNH